jgi:hypothetical protein
MATTRLWIGPGGGGGRLSPPLELPPRPGTKAGGGTPGEEAETALGVPPATTLPPAPAVLDRHGLKAMPATGAGEASTTG